jgi:hypothetical protein
MVRGYLGGICGVVLGGDCKCLFLVGRVLRILQRVAFFNRLHFNFMAYSMSLLLYYSQEVSREPKMYILDIFKTALFQTLPFLQPMPHEHYNKPPTSLIK